MARVQNRSANLSGFTPKRDQKCYHSALSYEPLALPVPESQVPYARAVMLQTEQNIP